MKTKIALTRITMITLAFLISTVMWADEKEKAAKKENLPVAHRHYTPVEQPPYVIDAVEEYSYLSANLGVGEISNYPNPFDRITTIEYFLPEAAFVTIDVKNMREGYGFSLLHEYQEVGHHRIVFDSKNHPPGTYMLLLSAKHYSATLIMIKKTITSNGRFEPK